MLKRKLLVPILRFLKQGMTPEKLSLAVALGLTCGAFPLIGPTTLLCFLVALLFRVNAAAVQFVNYISYPVQIICLIPFYKTGAWLFSAETFDLSASQLIAIVTEDFLKGLSLLSGAIFHAVVVWLIVAPIATIIIYYICIPVFRKMVKRLSMPETNLG